MNAIKQGCRDQTLQCKTAKQARRLQILQSEAAEQELHMCKDDMHCTMFVPRTADLFYPKLTSYIISGWPH